MYRVLIVDDEMPALRFVQSIIERFATNFQVAGVATSGEQGFQLLEQQMFDLLITDIGMRGMNGIELAQTRAPCSRISASSSSAATGNLSMRRARFKPGWMIICSNPSASAK